MHTTCALGTNTFVVTTSAFPPARRARPLARPLANYEGEGGPMALD